MIERWFPCAEVSENSNSGWGSGNQERNLFTWFAARPAAQAKAAVICSLLAWPDDEGEQRRLQELVRRAMTGRYEAWGELREEILAANPNGASVLDPFSGRGMIPLEAARLDLPSYGIDYSPVAVLASELLTDFPFRNWDSEPPLPFDAHRDQLTGTEPRLLTDVRAVLGEVGKRFAASMAEFYPAVEGHLPWGYLWAVTLPCQECGRRFPLVGSYELRKPSTKKATKTRPAVEDPGQSYFVECDLNTSKFWVVVHDGPPRRTPTLSNSTGPDGRKISGKSAVCPFCHHAHTTATQRRLSCEGQGRDELLVCADHNADFGKVFRLPTDAEHEALAGVTRALAGEAPFALGVPALPNEEMPDSNRRFVQPIQYGAKTFGDLMCDRQSLAFIRLARTINEISNEIAETGASHEYRKALSGYAAAQLVRKIRRATRGCALQPALKKVTDLFANDSAIAFSYDFFEAGIGQGPGTWDSLCRSGLSTLSGVLQDAQGMPTAVYQGSAASQPFASHSITAVVTDPPYDALIYYSDASDVLYVWLKRALASSWPELFISSDVRGLQDKTDEMIVKDFGAGPEEHRTREHYDTRIQAAFREAGRVVRKDGLVTIVFGHGEVEVWERLLQAISGGGLVLTGSWPANTESGSSSGRKANIKTTLTMACRPAPPDRPIGRRAVVEAAVRAEIKARFLDWERWGLAPTDMLMAAAGPAMEVVGRYSQVLDAKGEPVGISSFLPLARVAVQEAMAVEIDHHPLETFDARTRFALWWVRLFNRSVTAKSELRWQALAASLDVADIRDLVPDTDKGCAFVSASDHKADISPESAVIDVVLALGRSSAEGLEAMGEVLVAAGRAADDAYLLATLKFLAERLPDSDPDGIAFTRVLRSRTGLGNVVKVMEVAHETATTKQAAEDAQLKLM
jgi:adenine-specific DNA methylase